MGGEVKTIILSLIACALFAAESQPQLDPNKPADAVQIIDVLTQNLELPRAQAVALTVAIETLRRATTTPPPAPAVKDD